MSFQFIENGKIDEAARKLIRSHVMKGKNFGKMRPQLAGIDQEESFISREKNGASGATTSLNSPMDTESSEAEFLSIPRMIGNSFSPLTFHDRLQPYMSNLLAQFLFLATQSVYPIEFCLPMPNNKWLWIEYLQSDEAFFYSVLAMSEICVDAQLGKRETSPRALHHLSNTYRCLNQNLQDNVTPSDATIASVMSMAIHDDFNGHSERGKVHLDALQLMVNLRGGMAQFEANHLLTQKICRADIQYAIYTWTFPRFYRDEFPHEAIRFMLNHSSLQTEPFKVVDHPVIYDPRLKEISQDLMNVCNILNGNHMVSKLNPFLYQEILISVAYRLLHYDFRAAEQVENEKDNTMHLGMLAFMTTLLFQSGRFQPLSYGLLTHRLRNAIEALWVNELLEWPTFLWLLFVSGISVVEPVERSWLLPHIKTCLQVLRIDSWQNAHETLKRFPWIDIFHNGMGQELWRAVVWG